MPQLHDFVNAYILKYSLIVQANYTVSNNNRYILEIKCYILTVFSSIFFFQVDLLYVIHVKWLIV